jgi:bifunctional UDP-N-acetylglucosamine pyrophosphorylase/glucosamine-1-phosphate N-acetyltransferase
MTKPNCTCLILAAGKGTRMRANRAKVLHKIAGLELIGHVLAAARGATDGPRIVVTASDMDALGQWVQRHDPDAELAIQQQQSGTADAARAGLKAAPADQNPVLVVYGDTPLIETGTLTALLAEIERGAGLAVVGFEPADPSGYGRLIRDEKGKLAAIREHADASPAELKITACNSGIMAFSRDVLETCLGKIKNQNAKREFYLTDAVALAHEAGIAMTVVLAPEEQVAGINTKQQLAYCEHIIQQRLRSQAMEAGVTLYDPESVFFSHDTILARDVEIEPNVWIGPEVKIGSGALIRGFSHIEGAEIAAGATVGPFARVRPATKIGTGARVGNFVEIKNARIEPGAKINHLSYIGDAAVGAAANIGAGTITCNYDGFAKHKTLIGAGAFIGSNSSLIAPVTIGDGAYIGSGSVISRDVEPGALALNRADLKVKPGWAVRLRDRNKAGKRKRG